jgi:hypothetical protein
MIWKNSWDFLHNGTYVYIYKKHRLLSLVGISSYPCMFLDFKDLIIFVISLVEKDLKTINGKEFKYFVINNYKEYNNFCITSSLYMHFYC